MMTNEKIILFNRWLRICKETNYIWPTMYQDIQKIAYEQKETNGATVSCGKDKNEINRPKKM